MTALDHTTVQWRRVSAKYIWSELLGAFFWALVALAGVIVLLVIPDVSNWIALAPGAILLLILISIPFEWRRVRAIGYQLRQDDLVFRRGLFWSRMVAIPYGRLQLVDIQRGPVTRIFGLSSLKVVTAAAITNVTIPGLDWRDAEKLRDDLVALAETRRAGL
ncbi:PH domain-containing protein [Pseudoclavibacter sp. AY1H1]|uniref:PH domain-containing protein n=1 Tax=Pseudoclavibacter sp. AY1H1 TaxID=2080584 RepID=UPI000CE7F6A8|nr:PH domain-containing protein [Pseudoclavibacter sp. AY1H1]PPF34249.1 hypothetical protein C5E05_15210 [Pseudoclavibacter sp. AY1H1]